MSDNQFLVLASSSPRRLELLEKVGIIPQKVIPAEVDETPLKKEKPYIYVKRVSLEKALTILKDNPNAYIISADTIVVKGLRIFGKPASIDEARQMIKALSGGRHSVLTAFTIISPKGKIISKVVKTSVLVKNISTEELNWFLATKEWEGKSGAYGIQGSFEIFVKQINGCISNVIGLPLMQVYNSLVGLGYKFNYKNK